MRLSRFPDRKTFLNLSRAHNVIPVCAEILADTDTPVGLLGKFYQGSGPVFLLESVEGGERWGRYSFLGTAVRCHLRVFDKVVRIEENGRQHEIPHHGNPLAVLRTHMAAYRPARLPQLPRFWGGMVGYLSYEMVSFFEPIENRLPQDQALAHFVIPEALVIFDNLQHTLQCVVTAFVSDPAAAPAAYETALGKLEELLKTIQRPAAPLPVPSSARHLAPVLAEEVFRQRVSRVKDYIRAGDIIQAVISQPFTCKAPADPWTLYRAQRYVNPSPYLFFMHLDALTLIGSSPETMVRLENGVATLRPIAGTRPRGRNEQEDRALANELLVDEKERAEHLMLVDLGRNDLGRVAETGTVQVTDLMFVERYSHVMHLVSNIVCDLRPDCDAWELIRATFPAGTLSGAPKVRAMQIIAELENSPRRTYGGAVGYVGFGGNMDLAITIRTACIEGDTLTVRAGAGIVADSDPERERLETVQKAMALQRALTLGAE
ncbi:MAG TPA: anthranilate synthase component I [Desulfobacteraceae bacterium]|nr:MAG: anthranilate synthase component I [Deltaproteobacteria bacterium]HDI60051.1 anthranilate synthase component I [Desulfobacteraceae bacterium]